MVSDVVATVRELTLMVQKNELVESNRKMTVGVLDLDGLMAQIVSTLGLPDTAEYYLTSGSDTSTAVKSLEELSNKAKVQIWTVAGTSTTRDFTLMVQKNDLVASNRKMAASGIADLAGLQVLIVGRATQHTAHSTAMPSIHRRQCSGLWLLALRLRCICPSSDHCYGGRVHRRRLYALWG